MWVPTGRVMSEIVVVTGAASPVGRRVVAALLARPEVKRVVAVGADPDPRRLSSDPDDGPELLIAPFELDDSRLVPMLADATSLIHLGPRRGLDLDGSGGSDVDLAGTRMLLSMLARVAAIETVLVLSSALVYGARSDNPVPLTEEAPVRPNPTIAAAVDRAELEHLCRAWARTNGATCAPIRPAVVVGPENGRWLARSPWSTTGLQVPGAAPVQFIHVDDLTDAIVRVHDDRFDGPVNVAPDGWLTRAQVRALRGPTVRLRFERSLALGFARLGARFGVALGDPDTIQALGAPWVVANDRIRSFGWEPQHSNEEAYVESDRGGWWSRVTPRHRQELALGAGVAAIVGVGVTAAVLVRRHLRSTRQG